MNNAPSTFWVERSTDDELTADPQSPYRLCTMTGKRLALSVNDAIRAQKDGVPFRTWYTLADSHDMLRERGFNPSESEGR